MAARKKKKKTQAEKGEKDGQPAADGSSKPDSAPSAEFCPVLHALEVVGARWTLVLVRHLLTAPRRFQELRERTGIGPRVLSTRLAELIDRGLVEKVEVDDRAHYALTELGKTLEPIVREISLWWVRHAMAHFGPLDTTPASALEAVSFLTRQGRADQGDFTCDLRLTVREGGGWKLEVSDSALAPKSTPARGRDAVDAFAGGSVDWYPEWPDRPDEAN